MQNIVFNNFWLFGYLLNHVFIMLWCFDFLRLLRPLLFFFLVSICAVWHAPPSKIPRRENPPNSASLKRQQARVKQKKKEKRKKEVAELQQNFPSVLSALGDRANQPIPIDDDDTGTLPGRRRVILEGDGIAAGEATAECPGLVQVQADIQVEAVIPQEPVTDTEEEIQLAASADEQEEVLISSARTDPPRRSSPPRLRSVVVVPSSSALNRETGKRRRDNRAGHHGEGRAGQHKGERTGRRREDRADRRRFRHPY